MLLLFVQLSSTCAMLDRLVGSPNNHFRQPLLDKKSGNYSYFIHNSIDRGTSKTDIII